jgi:competence protein ComEC
VLSSPSKTLAISLATFCFGIFAGGIIPASWWGGLLLVCALALTCAVFARDQQARFIFILLTIFLFALFRVTQTDFGEDVPTVAQASSSAVRVEGVVDAEVERRANTQRVVLKNIVLAQSSVAGRLLVWAPLYPSIEYGNEIVFNCRVQKPEPFEGFAYDKYLESHGILAVCARPEYIDVRHTEGFSLGGTILSLKTFLLERLKMSMSEPHASFLAGLLFGGSSSLSSDLKDDFSATGTSHILAASGFNVSIFSMMFLSWILTTRVGRRRGLILTSILLFVYVIAAGATPAVVRAGIMGSLFVVQKWISRRGYLLNIILLTASLMLLVNPSLLHDVGFQLSFAATSAILTLTDPMSKRLAFIPKSFGLRQSFAGSLVAIAITMPILLWQFGQVSLVAPFANLLVLPFVVYAMALTALGLLGAVVSIHIGTLALLPAWGISYFVLTIISLFGAIPFAFIEPAYAQILSVATAVALAYGLYKFYASR